MAGAILVRPSLGYSCGSMMFSALVSELERISVATDWGSSDWLLVRDVGVLSLLDVDSIGAERSLRVLEDAARSMAARQSPLSGWEFDLEYWERVRDGSSEVVSFVNVALTTLEVLAGPAVVVPDDLTEKVDRLQTELLVSDPRLSWSRGLVPDLISWSALADDVASFWGFAENYVNELGCRNRLEYWLSQAPGDVREWLLIVVTEMDERFRANTRSADLGTPLTTTGGGAFWWLRRDPKDDELSALLWKNWQ